MTKDDADKILTEVLVKLGEHFDAVQILTSRVETDGTASQSKGQGDWYARQGLAHEFINQDQSQDLADMIAEKIEPKW